MNEWDRLEFGGMLFVMFRIFAFLNSGPSRDKRKATDVVAGKPESELGPGEEADGMSDEDEEVKCFCGKGAHVPLRFVHRHQ